MKMRVGKSMEGLNHRRDTEKETTTKDQSILDQDMTKEEGASTTKQEAVHQSVQTKQTADIHNNESIEKQMDEKAYETAKMQI